MSRLLSAINMIHMRSTGLFAIARVRHWAANVLCIWHYLLSILANFCFCRFLDNSREAMAAIIGDIGVF